ncbi:beta-carotene 3-hydroxylase 2, chloroplastic [Cryptomeria japonica]|uniref:beta-carotene 3-hydroxylase 2, chloroplastic n=1 Tax=Cryptomeria japonica TaxID=3369 RepID=UPI0027DA2CF6|nr:beta-carotene 3-hydroxylase 2, chloroplastic [Cryptomeria japonica]
MVVCISSPYAVGLCDSILSPAGVNRAVSPASFNAAARFSSNLMLGRESSRVCARRKKMLPGLCFVFKENEGQIGEQSLEFADSLRRAVEKEEKGLSSNVKANLAALAWSLGITGTAAAAIYYRFLFVMKGEELPYTEMMGTVLVAAVAAVGMEHWARWVHRTFWHGALWSIHESHHRPRDGPFEMNDIFTILNSIPANVLLTYGLYCKGLVPSLCFGAGIGITIGGLAYIIVHDGLIDRRFPVGPLGDIPYLRKVAAAHQIHHADKFDGIPFGILLGPSELKNLEGGPEELEKFVSRRRKASRSYMESKDVAVKQ